jgi:pyridinium-3,5-biscarboxylic acid mononucleotide sulfurtransferase
MGWAKDARQLGGCCVSFDEHATRAKQEALHRLLLTMPSAVTAFSGGADSAFLAFMAHAALADRALAVTADSPSLARSELEDAIGFARQFGLRHQVMQTDELEDAHYVRNSADRCYFCKSALMNALETLLKATGSGEILVGVNTDDLGDFRPGQNAVRERGGRWPLVEVGLSKAEVRWLSRELGLPTWDKPAAACLSSRIAYGVPVTREALRRIEAAEGFLKRLGLAGQIRVRDQGHDLARIETDPENLGVLVARRREVIDALKAAGFLFVTLDLEGYRSGSHNASLGIIPMSQIRPKANGITREADPGVAVGRSQALAGIAQE